ncbi:hypothetical protein AMJ57_03245 [Parcubacteria bacterium SG8_24]|nr:MAG: hypothetical protein AMJ57_03245 [Parcubacteria bacterium SG8_24]
MERHPTTAKSWVEVSRSALRHNAQGLKRLITPGSAFMAVVKSNAYGHGTAEVVRSIRDIADWFGVDSLVEAEEVRGTGVRQPILILGYVTPQERVRATRLGFSQVIGDRAGLKAAAAGAGRNRPAKLHLKIETGTSRQGILMDKLPAFARYASRLPHVVIEGISTHFANIEDASDASYAMRQLDRFRKSVGLLEGLGIRPRLRHVACSAAAILYPETHFDLVRIGISLYGLWPSELTRQSAKTRGRKLELRPALRWKTSVAQVKALPRGTPVSYGLTERLRRDSSVAVLPTGYWDGLDRRRSSVGHVLVRGRKVKILGRVCMNMCMVDVTGLRGVRSDDEVVILGSQGRQAIGAEEIADELGTINYEVVTRINPRLPRVVVA